MSALPRDRRLISLRIFQLKTQGVPEPKAIAQASKEAGFPDVHAMNMAICSSPAPICADPGRPDGRGGRDRRLARVATAAGSRQQGRQVAAQPLQSPGGSRSIGSHLNGRRGARLLPGKAGGGSERHVSRQARQNRLPVRRGSSVTRRSQIGHLNQVTSSSVSPSLLGSSKQGS